MCGCAVKINIANGERPLQRKLHLYAPDCVLVLGAMSSLAPLRRSACAASAKQAPNATRRVLRAPPGQRSPRPLALVPFGGVTGVLRLLRTELQRNAEISNGTIAGGSRDGASAPPIVDEVLRSPGAPLDSATRQFMEARFQRDFGPVRIHTNDEASRSAEAVGARAYTVGARIAFRNGQYAPASPDGRRLLAHELAHVVQQSGNRSGAPAVLARSPDDAASANVGVAASALGPPGNCTWDQWYALQQVVRQECKVNMPRACLPGDSPDAIREKIAHFQRCIEARVNLNNTCFGGGDPGHLTEVVNLTNGLRRCQEQFVPVPNPKPQEEPQTSDRSSVWEFLAALGLGVSTILVVIAALADPEPASKLALAGLSAAMIAIILKRFGADSSETPAGA